MSDEKRGFTPAPEKVSIQYQYQHTLYPAQNYKPGFVNEFWNSVRRSVANINPFAQQQIPTEKRVGFAPKYGWGFYVPDAYPNGIIFQNSNFPNHYDPLKDMRRPQVGLNDGRYGTNRSLPAIYHLKIPRFCYRQIQFYKRCVIVNGQANCKQEQDNILNICPDYVLDGLRQKKLKQYQILVMANRKYREVMQLSSYNQGRSIANVADKTWIDGSAQRLRPDTMWADQRYVDITQKEINEAKKRNEERKLKKGEKPQEKHWQRYDWKTAQPRFEKPLYP